LLKRFLARLTGPTILHRSVLAFGIAILAQALCPTRAATICQERGDLEGHVGPISRVRKAYPAAGGGYRCTTPDEIYGTQLSRRFLIAAEVCLPPDVWDNFETGR
jgi:hypothetical protein